MGTIKQKEFGQILDRYIKGICTLEEQKLVEKWYEEVGAGSHLLIDDRQHQQIESRMWNRIAPHSFNKSQKRVSYWKVSALAASILLAVTLFIALKPSLSTIPESLGALTDFETAISNDGKSPKLFSLEDGSKITLQPNSQLLYSSPFKKDKREVKLIGSAFFEVAHDAQRPFLVYTKDVVTKVLGTSFTINAHEQDKAVTVSVKTGRVFVSRPTHKILSGHATEEAILTPNQKAVFDLNKNELVTTLADDPQPVISEEEVKAMKFDDVRVAVILQDLEKIYGVKISFDENILRSCVITTVFSDESLYDRLRIICKAIDGTFETQGTTIILQSHGCTN
ncbi:MAG TPA: FecR domain-containing protein [Cyclobacteriaceae bacterium]